MNSSWNARSLFAVPLRVGLVVTAVAATLVVSAVTAVAEPGAAAPVDTGVGSTYACSGDVAGAEQDPVVLIHGTATTSVDDFGAVVQPWLTQTGRPYCTVELPDFATVDMQISTQYVVDAIERTSRTRGGAVDVVGHSQGGTLGLWAIDTHPEVAAVVDDYVGLAPALRGQSGTDRICRAVGGCAGAVWQFGENADFMNALESTPLADGPSFTTVATTFDQIVRPAPFASSVDGASNVVIQDVCPGKFVEHVALPSDATAVAVMADALDNDGPAVPERIGTDSCGRLTPPGIDPLAPLRGSLSGARSFVEAQLATEFLPAEPPFVGP